MENFERFFARSDQSIRDAMAIVDRTGFHTCFVVDRSGSLAGVLADGDIRRGMLAGHSLDEPVAAIMNRTPKLAHVRDPRSVVHAIMQDYRIDALPIVDEQNRIVDVVLSSELQLNNVPVKENWVVLMAGGLGTRLLPLTASIAKPMLPIGNRPILEIVISNFIAHGFRNFFVSVNYKREQIKEYFGDGGRFGITIKYLEEEKRLGTVGALGLLPKRPTSSTIVMNGDILSDVDVSALLSFHEESRAVATICVHEYGLQVPFGVVQQKSGMLLAIDEKPVQKFLINAGIYVFESDVLTYIGANQAMEIPTLLRQLVDSGKSVSTFPIRERWIDVGRFDDLERARLEWELESVGPGG